jgi:CheY-like chemotaxis protein
MILYLSTSGAGSRSKVSALIVEDDPASRESMIKILKIMGMNAQGATTLAEGFTALAARPEALILDLMLPDGNGIELLRRIRQEKLPIRVAILSGADKPMLTEAEALQPDALFTKPVDLTRLVKWLNAA